jgi:hypothetical protein
MQARDGARETLLRFRGAGDREDYATELGHAGSRQRHTQGDNDRTSAIHGASSVR